MEYLRNLPSKSDAFTAATYERVRHEPGHVNRPYFSTKAKGPSFLMVSSDENLVMDAMRRRKAVDLLQRTPVGFPPVPSLSSIAPSTWTSAVPTPPQVPSPSSTSFQIQQQEQEQEQQQQQFRRQREAGQEPGDGREASRSNEPQRTYKRPRIAISNAAAVAAANGGRSSGSSIVSSASSVPSRGLSSSSSSSKLPATQIAPSPVPGGSFNRGDGSLMARSRPLPGPTSSMSTTTQVDRSINRSHGSSASSSSSSSSTSSSLPRPRPQQP